MFNRHLETDEFASTLWDIYRRVQSEGYVQVGWHGRLPDVTGDQALIVFE